MRFPRPCPVPLRSRLALVAVATLFAGACSNGEEGAAGSTATSSTAPTTTTTTTVDPLGATCEASEYRVEYLVGWAVNDPARVGPCRYFHPAPFTVPEATEFLDRAVSVDVDPVAYAEAVAGLGPPSSQVISRQEVTVDGKPAVKALVVSTGEALLDKGVRSYQYLVDLGDETFLASTLDIAAAGSFETNRKVVDQMMASVRFKECSAEGARISGQDRLPEPVAQMRQDIAAAAAACDYDRLGELALAGGDRFTSSFGGSGDAVGSWRRAETENEAPDNMPLAFLVGMLDRPFDSRDGDGTRQYFWPSAFGYDRWEDVPVQDKEALEPLYGEEAFESFARFGSYAGYRVGITAEGDWVFFVAGD